DRARSGLEDERIPLRVADLLVLAILLAGGPGRRIVVRPRPRPHVAGLDRLRARRDERLAVLRDAQAAVAGKRDIDGSVEVQLLNRGCGAVAARDQAEQAQAEPLHSGLTSPMRSTTRLYRSEERH